MNSWLNSDGSRARPDTVRVNAVGYDEQYLVVKPRRSAFHRDMIRHQQTSFRETVSCDARAVDPEK